MSKKFNVLVILTAVLYILALVVTAFALGLANVISMLSNGYIAGIVWNVISFVVNFYSNSCGWLVILITILCWLAVLSRNKALVKVMFVFSIFSIIFAATKILLSAVMNIASLLQILIVTLEYGIITSYLGNIVGYLMNPIVDILLMVLLLVLTFAAFSYNKKLLVKERYIDCDECTCAASQAPVSESTDEVAEDSACDDPAEEAVLVVDDSADTVEETV